MSFPSAGWHVDVREIPWPLQGLTSALCERAMRCLSHGQCECVTKDMLCCGVEKVPKVGTKMALAAKGFLQEIPPGMPRQHHCDRIKLCSRSITAQQLANLL